MSEWDLYAISKDIESLKSHSKSLQRQINGLWSVKKRKARIAINPPPTSSSLKETEEASFRLKEAASRGDMSAMHEASEALKVAASLVDTGGPVDQDGGLTQQLISEMLDRMAVLEARLLKLEEITGYEV